MAQHDLDASFGTVDKRRAVRAGNSANNYTTDANFADINAMRTRLAAAAPASYTTARLEQMTKNDMLFALRQLDEAGSI